MSGRLEFPYREVLGELTHEASLEGFSPFDALARFTYARLDRGLGTDDYISTPLTSGGHAFNPDLTKPEVIEKNTKLALDITQQLAINRQIEPARSIEAAALGYIPHWAQSDYMKLWLAIEGGFILRPDSLKEDADALEQHFDNALDRFEVNMDLINSGAHRNERLPEYHRMAGAIARMVTGGEHEARPVDRVVGLFDLTESVGSDTEQYFASLMGRPVMAVTIVRPATLDEFEGVNPELANQFRNVEEYGATVIPRIRENYPQLRLEEVGYQPMLLASSDN